MGRARGKHHAVATVPSGRASDAFSGVLGARRGTGAPQDPGPVAPPLDLVWVAKFKDQKGYWVIVNGDPTNKVPMNFLTAQKLHNGQKALGESIYTGGSATDISYLKAKLNEFEEPFTTAHVEYAPTSLD